MVWAGLLIQAISAASTVALFLVAWIQIKSLSVQARTDFADRLTQQYREIMRDIPLEIWLGSELKELAGDERQSRCRDAIYRYIDLAQEQAFLFGKNRIAEEIWEEWSTGIRSNFCLKAFGDVWQEVKTKHPDNFAELKRLVG
jgi:hypothetical protein